MTNYYSDERAAYVRGNRAKFAHYGAEQRDRLKMEMVDAYGGKCNICGMTNPIALCIDHKGDDPRQETELFYGNSRGGDKLYWQLKAQGWPKDRFQLLCYNCNAIKEHQRRREALIERWGPKEKGDRTTAQTKIRMKRHNTSGIKGVFWNSQKRRWNAKMMDEYRQVYLGLFPDTVEGMVAAGRAYRKAAIARWGENATTQTDEELIKAALAWYTPMPSANAEIDMSGLVKESSNV